jgi:hypothetical protein
MFRDATFTHHQERKQLYLQYLLFVTPLLLSAAIVDELELLGFPAPICRYRGGVGTYWSSDFLTIAADSINKYQML